MKKLIIFFMTASILTIGNTHPAELARQAFSRAGVPLQSIRIDANARVSSVRQAGEIIRRLGTPGDAPGTIRDEYGNLYYVDIKTNGADTRLLLTAEPDNSAAAVYDKIALEFTNVYLSAKGQIDANADPDAVNRLLMEGCGASVREMCKGDVTSFSGYTSARPNVFGEINVQTAVTAGNGSREALLGFPYIVFEY